MPTNRERFAEVYAVKLAEAIARNPEDYLYPASRIPEVIAQMMPALAKGSANFGPAIKATARALGIRVTIGAVKTFLAE